ncbi:MAG: hypothetical protein HZB13_21290 [Acidobacteria bacterium]|nr:hypothetical protein [Acidobacteriota bacterium]
MRQLISLALFTAAALAQPAQPPVTILEIDMENVVNYVDDLADPSKKATSPAVSPISPNLIWAYKMNLTQGDIVAVNGKPAKGLFVQQYGTRVVAATTLTPGSSIADLGGGCQLQAGFMILQPDGTPIGTIMATGTTAMGPPPGAPTTATAFNFAIVGGTGAFLGARGQTSRSRATGVRNASMIEDPAYRRLNGGGTQRFVVHLVQMATPEVIVTSAGPAIYHGDNFSPVTPESPARAGEWLVMAVSNLGPTRPGVDPGKPFPAWDSAKPMIVSSPVDVSVGGLAAEVRNAIGWPEQTNVYRVDFRVPDGTKPGSAGVALAAAWIAGQEVKLPVR